MSGQNWRTEVDAVDYFGHQQKKVNLADRRPVIRRPADLVGPGIGPNAITITDFNDLLATFNGYYAAEPGAQNAPTDDQSFTGFTVSEGAMGGTQAFYGMTDGRQYTRVFNRSEKDPATLFWGPWSPAVSSADLAAMGDRATILERRVDELHPLYTGALYFWLTNGPPGYAVSGTAEFGLTFPTVPAVWAIKGSNAGGSGDMTVSLVDQITRTDCRITVLNTGPNLATFEDLRIRWFAQEVIVSTS